MVEAGTRCTDSASMGKGSTGGSTGRGSKLVGKSKVRDCSRDIGTVVDDRVGPRSVWGGRNHPWWEWRGHSCDRWGRSTYRGWEIA